MKLTKYVSAVTFSLVLMSQNLNAISDGLKNDIQCLVKNNPHQLNETEYTSIAEILTNKTPCNMLVFGLGKDSKLWMDNNSLGKTVFLEDDKTWFDRICAEIPGINAYLVNYNSQRKDWQNWLKGNTQDLLLDLPSEILETKWDIIFVDAPAGWSDETPGRMKSIYTAAHLAHKSKGCHVFVHDCNRKVEAVYCSKFLLDENLVSSPYKLRHYFIPK